MFAIRQIIEDPQEVIPIPMELRHRRTEVIFIAMDEDMEALRPPVKQALSTKSSNFPRANWFDNYQAEADIDIWELLPTDDAAEEWQW